VGKRYHAKTAQNIFPLFCPFLPAEIHLEGLESTVSSPSGIQSRIPSPESRPQWHFCDVLRP